MIGKRTAKFWRWFEVNQDRLFGFESDQDRVFTDLTQRLRKVGDDLTFEFGPIGDDGKREFVISADGIKSSFPIVEDLHQAAPNLERWIWVKFRPRRQPINDLTFNGTSVRSDEVHFVLAQDGDRVGVVLFFEG